jgi:hypothetical protein
MPVPPHVDAAYRKSLNDTLAYYTSLPGDQSKQITAIASALALEIGHPAATEGTDLASQYHEAVRSGIIKKPTRPRSSMTNRELKVQDAINFYELLKTPERPYTTELQALEQTLSLPNGDPKGKYGTLLAESRNRNVKKRNVSGMTNSQKAKFVILQQLKATGDPAHTGRIAELEAALRGNSNTRRRPYNATPRNRNTRKNKNYKPRVSSPLARQNVREPDALDEANDAALQFLRNLGEH